MKQKFSTLPHVGMRIVKSSAAIFLCYLIYLLRGKQGIVFYSHLSALWCIQSYMDTSLSKAIQRTIGTLIGAVFGLIVILFNLYILQGNPELDFIKYLIISLMIIPIIYTTVLLKKPDASYFSCVVFLSIVVMHLTENPFLFVFNRVCDTMIGIVVGMGVNVAHLPRIRKQNTLFVSGVDDVLVDQNELIPPYTRVQLNQMIASGIHFTISTERTPASLIPTMNGIHLNLPIIAMNGAVLFDLKENRYIKTYVISHEKTCEIISFIRAEGFHCFVNAILEDMLVIYHQQFHNDAETDIYNRMHTSPYRNYLFRELPDGVACIYLMIIDETEKIEALVQKLELQDFSASVQIIHYPSTDYSGYSYVKIYNKNATKKNMLHYLCSTINCTEAVTFGTIPGQYDYVVPKNKPDETTKLIKQLYEPLYFDKFISHKKSVS